MEAHIICLDDRFGLALRSIASLDPLRQWLGRDSVLARWATNLGLVNAKPAWGFLSTCTYVHTPDHVPIQLSILATVSEW